MTLHQRFLKQQSKFIPRIVGYRQKKARFHNMIKIMIDMYRIDPCLENLAKAKQVIEFVRNIKN